MLTWVFVLMLWYLGSYVYVLPRMGDVAPLSNRIGHAHGMWLVFWARSLLWGLWILSTVDARARATQDAHQWALTSSICFNLRQSNFSRVSNDLYVNFRLQYSGWLESSIFESAALDQLFGWEFFFLVSTLFVLQPILLTTKLGLWAVELLLKVANIFV